MINGKRLGELQTRSSPSTPTPSARLKLDVPGRRRRGRGRGPARRARSTTRSSPATDRRAAASEGPCCRDALSDYSGQPLRLVEAGDRGTAVDRGRMRRRLADLAGVARAAGRRPSGDGRDRRAPVPDADRGRRRRRSRGGRVGRPAGPDRRGGVGFDGHVGRCLITSRDPDTGEVDLPTLDMLRELPRRVDDDRAASVRDLRRGRSSPGVSGSATRSRRWVVCPA